MDAKTRAMLNDAEQELLRSTTVTAMRKLDEAELLVLHDRVRRARTKYVTLHRRRGSARVRADRSRTRSDAAGERTLVKAEAFEDALARVSGRLAEVAAKAAEALKAERLAAAASVKSDGAAKPASPTKSVKSKKGSAKRTTGGSTKTGRARAAKPVEKKRAASSRASQKRSQAKRDGRG